MADEHWHTHRREGRKEEVYACGERKGAIRLAEVAKVGYMSCK